MRVLFGHPTGTPFAHHAALSHFDAGRLAAFCVPWMPRPATLSALSAIPPLKPMAQRLGRRYFPPLARAPLVQGRLGEWRRLLVRAIGGDNDALVREANEWLMRVMTRECRRADVTAVHAYEDCSLEQFIEAKRLGKACIYDMPIGYFRAWDRLTAALDAKYADWLKPGRRVEFASPAQKQQEMALADLVLAPSRFVADGVHEFFPDKRIAIAPFGVDIDAWPFEERRAAGGVMTFLFAGQCSVRKGTPLLLRAWQAAGLKDARLKLVGSWGLAEDKRAQLPPGCDWIGPVSRDALRAHYRAAEVFVFPTNFEGSPLVVGEAASSGLPVLTTRGSGGDSILDEQSGRIIDADDLDALVEALRWFDHHRDEIPALGRAARASAERFIWARYRAAVSEAVAEFA